jgi:MFS family permease
MALCGKQLVPNATLATLPLALAPVSTMLLTVPAARFMQRRGRRPGFALGAILGIFGALICATAVVKAHFLLLCLGAMVLGGFNGFATYFRFAAAEAAPEEFRSRAISLVMAGGIVAAFTGTNLATYARGWFESFPFAGPFLSIVLLHSGLLLLLSFTRLPKPQAADTQSSGRPLSVIARQPDFLLAVIGAFTSWGVMSLLMNATPLSMQRHHHPFNDTAWVIQWHVLGMYVPSFFTGHLIRWWGEHRIMAAGLFLLMSAALVNMGGTELNNYWLGLTLLGVGWNFLFIGSTTLLTQTYEPAEKARVQAFNDFTIFAIMVLSSFSAGPLETAFGWSTLNLLAVPLVLLVGFVFALIHVRRKLQTTG